MVTVRGDVITGGVYAVGGRMLCGPILTPVEAVEARDEALVEPSETALLLSEEAGLSTIPSISVISFQNSMPASIFNRILCVRRFSLLYSFVSAGFTPIHTHKTCLT